MEKVFRLVEVLKEGFLCLAKNVNM